MAEPLKWEDVEVGDWVKVKIEDGRVFSGIVGVVSGNNVGITSDEWTDGIVALYRNTDTLLAHRKGAH